ncbi:penicillin-binding transpeptidase domain-containing protein [Aquibacillus koreensis]|uniref:serine-type D-Ala-D-Ala carboxypeptidase n=2 Tax=Aquibacillus koreensis TaxID=279446 RepID=A0A9X3WIW8_9BACI|nr:penicillin-binding transpeptidase domain-containing protein [Aquibacillus koreensis]MCT2538064.1 penicillin-binding transpeptidase domain-containing protein [Aquibacillus koreensis]MDC3420587.1 penicillin-binding transpeptidase domain-containing protein [Aquibacillus koreensis]
MSAVIMLLFVVMFLTVSGRFLYIQGTGEVEGVFLQDWADKRRTNTYEIEAQRGTIYDRNGMVLAQDRATYRVQAILRDVYYASSESEDLELADPRDTADTLAPLIGMESNEVLERIEFGIENERFQVEFGKNGQALSQEMKEEIDAKNIPGIQLMKESKRFYPNGMFASHIIGFAQQKVIENEDGETKTFVEGITGIENQFNEQLVGKNGSISYQRDKYNVKLLDSKEMVQQAEDGKDIYLTIDQKIQTILEDSMTQVEDQYAPERMTAVVMDAKTGEVLAMSNRPSYNPNQIGEVANWYNDVISTPFEPGSTMKVFTLAAAIEEGVYDPNERYKSGSYKIDEITYPLHDWKTTWGEISYEEGIQRSSNVAVSKLVWEKMGTETFLDYLNAFDFDQESGIDLPGEQAGRILYDWPIEKLTTSYGQGTTTTPIQLVKAASAITNKGDMVQPFVVSKVVDSKTGKVIEEHSPEVVGNPISEQTSKKVLDTLETVITSENGTGHNVYNLSDYSVAGKTGTAQIPDTENLYPGSAYLKGDENYIFSFLGMAPKDDPQLIMYVSVKQPDLDLENYESGSAPVSFIFKNVMENSLHYLNIDPDKDSHEPIHTITAPKLVGGSVQDAKMQLEEKGIVVTVIGDGNEVVKTSVAEDQKILPNERVLIITDAPKMPDIIGWSLRDVLKLSDLLELDLEVIGSGFANAQSIDAGTEVMANDYLMAEFSSPNTSISSSVDEEIEDNKETDSTSVEDVP